jgi:transcriptional regulator with XRE-family HTH domain
MRGRRPPLNVTALSMNLSNARRRMAWSQSEVARLVGCSQSLVSDWELGRRVPSAEQLHLLARALHVDAEELKPER